MKVLLLSPLPPPVGGIASWTVNVLEHYKNDSAINLTHQNTAIKSRTITQSGFFTRLFSGAKDAIKVIIVFISLLIKDKPDVVHVTSSGSMGLWKDLVIAVIAKLHRTPVVIHFHFGRIPDLSKRNNWEWKLLKVVISLCSATMVLDDKTYNTLINHNFNSTYNMPNPISNYVENFLSEYNEHSAEAGQTIARVVFVGHITINKGVFELAKACTCLNNKLELLLIGPYEEDVKECLLSISSDTNVDMKFTGVLAKKAVLNEIKNASVLVLPSYSEGFPNVILEAMAMNCPIVATDVGAISDMLDATTTKPAGLVVEPKNVQALTGAISQLITDKPLSEFLAGNAFKKVNEKYTLNNVCAQYETVWNSVHNNREV